MRSIRPSRKEEAALPQRETIIIIIIVDFFRSGETPPTTSAIIGHFSCYLIYRSTGLLGLGNTSVLSLKLTRSGTLVLRYVTIAP